DRMGTMANGQSASAARVSAARRLHRAPSRPQLAPRRWLRLLAAAAVTVGLWWASPPGVAAGQSSAAELIPLPQRQVELPVMACGALLPHAFPQVDHVTFRLLSASVHAKSPGGAEFCVVNGYVAPQVQFVL